MPALIFQVRTYFKLTMSTLFFLIESNILVAFVVLVAAFAILAKCADLFVDSSVSLAHKLKIPKLVIGIVLVSLATTAPELAVSLMSALQDKPEMALGNAIGSVICDDGLALALAGIFAVAPIMVIPHVLRTSGLFLLFLEVLVFVFVFFDNTLNRIEGVILVGLFVSYIAFLYRQHKTGKFHDDAASDDSENPAAKKVSLLFALFAVSLAGIIISSRFVIASATSIAHFFHIPETIIALTLVAHGTSIPEVATCIVAARKRQGAIAVGNIIGADIMNICWVAGASSIVNDLALGRQEILFMFPSMFVIVGAMLLLLRYGYSLTRLKGAVLLGLYLIYMYLAFFVMKFPVHH